MAHPQYIVDRTRKLEEHNAHFQLCLRIKQPFIAVWPRTKFAEVSVDIDSLQQALSEEGQEQVRQAFLDARGEKIHVTAGLCSAKKIPVSLSEDVARKLFQIATHYQVNR